METARELTGARYAAVGVLAPNGRELERFITAGLSVEEREVIGDLPRGLGVLGLLISDPKPLRLAAVGAHEQSYGFPAGHPPMTTFLGVPVSVRGAPWGNLYLTDKASGDFDEVDEETILVLADWATTAIDNARIHGAEQARRAELERSVLALATTTEITRAVAGETRVDRVLELIAKRGRALVEARGVVILLPSKDHLVVTAMAGAFDRELLGARVPVAGSATGLVHSSGRAERLSDAPSRLRFALAERLDATTGLLVPMLFHGRRIGVLGAFDRLRGGPEFTVEDQRLMEAFAASAATALASAQTVAAESLRRSIEASEQERTRWARELHDGTLQDLAAVKLGLATGRKSSAPDAARASVDAAISQIDDTILGLRSLITDLRPPSLDTVGPGAAIETLAERVRERSGIEVSLDVDLATAQSATGPRHPPALEIALYRIAQEALTNASRHASASHIAISIAEAEATITLIVGDDGAGFDLDADQEGFGLIGMRERVALLGGRLTVSSTIGRGTTIRAELPIPPPLADDGAGRAAPGLR